MKRGVSQMLRICLTFDDGPCPPSASIRSPTADILTILAEEGICAAFFVLTGPDRWLRRIYPKGETPADFKLMVRSAQEGHLLACHAGGNYQSQFMTHPIRLHQPAYAISDNGPILKQTTVGNALETDLLSCRQRIEEAYAKAGLQELPIRFVRPPLWRYRSKEGDARPTYRALGLSMILTDVKLNDGGYVTAGIPRPNAMIKRMVKLAHQGERDLIATLHDSNRLTAYRLPKLIAAIRKAMTRQHLEEGRDWQFTTCREEIADLFDRKQVFHQTGYVRALEEATPGP